jgi:pyruvate/2-oxoglutarate dehydrogenase complex dihydrolipoamide acyltransferase (E2) component
MTRNGSSVLAFVFLSGSSLAFAQAPKPAEKPAAPAAAPAKAAPAAPAAATNTTAKPAAPAVAPAAAPTAAAPPAVPTPSPELDTLYKGLEGSWKCDTTMAAGAVGPGSPELKVKSMVKIAKAKDLGGFWYRGEYEIKKTKTVPGFKGTFMLGYDAMSKAALNVSYDNTGAAGLSTGANPSGDTVTFVGESYMMGQKMKTRETMIKKSPKEVEHKFEADLGKGFQLMGTDECKK